jgi:NAD(P)-dependent dehydrogenase (short-subunit alcohol dehydrogenase family)
MAVGSERSVLIVGATKGLGQTLAGHFDSQGYRTFTVGQGEPTLNLKRNQNFDIDICQPESVQKCVKSIPMPLDGVIFSQRYRGDNPLTGEISTSIMATAYFIEALKPKFAERFCSVVMVGSVLAEQVSLEMDLSYHICKAALAQMTKFYAVALKDQAMFNCLQLGTFVKPESEKFFEKDKAFFENLSPQGRLMRCQDLFSTFQFLIGEKPRFLSGQALTMDGGITNQWIESYGKARFKA